MVPAMCHGCSKPETVLDPTLQVDLVLFKEPDFEFLFKILLEKRQNLSPEVWEDVDSKRSVPIPLKVTFIKTHFGHIH